MYVSTIKVYLPNMINLKFNFNSIQVTYSTSIKLNSKIMNNNLFYGYLPSKVIINTQHW